MDSSDRDVIVPHGSLVALEGDAEQISIQLRLLPQSPKFLVLPAVTEAVQPNENETFDARAYVRDVHTKFVDRVQMARSFLQSATIDQPRLVFLNGGCVSARAACIAAICERITAGNIDEAENILEDIVKDGTAGLMMPARPVQDQNGQVAELPNPDPQDSAELPLESHSGADTLDAADAAALKPRDASIVQSDSAEELKHSMSASLAGPFSDATLMPQDGYEVYADDDDEASSPEQVTEKDSGINVIPDHSPRRSRIFLQPILPHSHDEAVSPISRTAGPPSPFSPVSSALSETDHVGSKSEDLSVGSKQEVFEAVAVTVQPSGMFKRSRSVDRFYPRDSAMSGLLSRQTSARRSASLHNLRDLKHHDRSEDYELPHGRVFMRASRAQIMRIPTWNSQDVRRMRYVDRGTDAEEITFDNDLSLLPYEPIFPIVEDLIICFTGSHDDEIMQSVIRSYKSGSRPRLYSQANYTESAYSQGASRAASQRQSMYEPEDEAGNEAEVETEQATPKPLPQSDDDDPFNPDNYPLIGGSTRTPKVVSKNNEPATVNRPPTPATTPPPLLPEVAKKFYDFSPVNANNAVGVQNSLRVLLKTHFPDENGTYSQYDVPTETDRLWKPVFRNDQGQGLEGRTVDQIIALGGEDGVKKEVFADISGRVEKLGTKNSGLSRVGKLDIRYLIANAMQTYTSQPLACQTSQSPFSNPTHLATLLIPHIERYLSINASARLLILTYPASYLATILALRKLLGSDIIKVAGIVDSTSSEPESQNGSAVKAHANKDSKPFPLSNSNFEPRTRNRGKSTTSQKSNNMPNSSKNPSQSTSNPPLNDVSASFSKANFLLPSTATPAEIQSFVTAIWKTLIDKSEFYAPEAVEEARKRFSNPPLAPGSTVPLPPAPADSERPRSPTGTLSSIASTAATARQMLKAARLLGRDNTNSSSAPNHTSTPSHHGRQSSRTSQRDFARTANGIVPPMPTSRGGPPKSAGADSAAEREKAENAAWENFYIGEDSDEDEIARILMPKVPKRGEKKVTSRKALKFLGLA